MKNQAKLRVRPTKLDYYLDWDKILALEDVESMKLISSCFLLGVDVFYQHKNRNTIGWPLSVVSCQRRLPFPSTLMNHLASLCSIIDFGADHLSIDRNLDDACFCSSEVWQNAIQTFELPIEVIEFGEESKRPLPEEIWQQLPAISQLEDLLANTYAVSWNGQEYLVLGGNVTYCHNLKNWVLEYIYLSPDACFDLSR
jgi:hypothetical protein